MQHNSRPPGHNARAACCYVYFTDSLALDPVRLTITCILNIVKKFNPFRTYAFLIRAFSTAPSLQRLLYSTFSKNPLALSLLGFLKNSSGLASSTICPSSIKQMRSDTSLANPISWVTRAMVMPV